MTSLGKRIAKARRDAGVRQQDLANTLQVSVKAVQRWELDENRPRHYRLRAIAEATGKSLFYFLTDDGEEPRDLTEEVMLLRKRLDDLATGIERGEPIEDSADERRHPGVEGLLANEELCKTLGVTPAQGAALRRVRTGTRRRIETVNQAIQMLAVVQVLEREGELQ